MEKISRIINYEHKICNEVVKLNLERNELIKEYKKRKITISLIAEKTGISRKTLYNKKKLIAIIEKLQSEQEKDDLIYIIDSLKQKVSEYEEIISKLVTRDFEFMTYKLRISELEHIIKMKDNEIKNCTDLLKSYKNFSINRK